MNYTETGTFYVGAWVVVVKASGHPSKAHYITSTNRDALIPLCEGAYNPPLKLRGDVLAVNDPDAPRCAQCVARRERKTRPQTSARMAAFLAPMGGDL